MVFGGGRKELCQGNGVRRAWPGFYSKESCKGGGVAVQMRPVNTLSPAFQREPLNRMMLRSLQYLVIGPQRPKANRDNQSVKHLYHFNVIRPLSPIQMF